MMRFFVLSLASLSLLVPRAVLASEPMVNALAVMPADAIGFVCVPSLKQLDANYQQMIVSLGLQMFVPPPNNSVLGLLKQTLPVGDGLDENGALAVVAMPAADLASLANGMALIAPANDAKAFLTGLGGTEGENGVWTVQSFGPPAYAVASGKRVILARTPDSALAVANAKQGLATRFSKTDLETASGLDLVVWLDAARGIEATQAWLKPMIAGLMAMQAAAGGEAAVAQADAAQKQMDMVFNGLASVMAGVSLGQSGVTLRGMMSARPDTDLAKQISVAVTSQSLLIGLPAETYLLAFGQRVEPEYVQNAVQYLDPYWAMLTKQEGVDAKVVEKLQGIVKDWSALGTGARAVANALPQGPNGMFAGVALFETTDSAKWVALFGEVVETVKQLLTGLASVHGEDLKKVVEALVYTPAAETLGGVSVNKLVLKLETLTDVGEDELGVLEKLLGGDRASVRVGAVDGKTVAVSLGGGSAHFEKMIGLVKAESAPLDDDAGIKKVAAAMPRARGSVFYVPLDNIARTAKATAAAFGQQAFPFEVPQCNAPIGVTGSGGKGWSRADVLFPTELLSAAKDVAMMVMMSQAQQQMQAEPGAAESEGAMGEEDEPTDPETEQDDEPTEEPSTP